MKSSRALPALPVAVSRSLGKLGRDLSSARKRRRLTMALVAERALISRTTLSRVERGDPGVSLGIYATVLFVLGMAERLGDLADPRHDAVGLGLEEERLPQRVRLPSKRTIRAAH
jgi:transcriptional regulator with XRE-family HTH domain